MKEAFTFFSALIVLILGLTPEIFSHSEKAQTQKDDLKALAGEWRTGEKSLAKIECTFEPGDEVFRPQGRVKIVAGTKEDWHGNAPFDLKEQGGERYIVFESAVEKISGLPRRWRYKLENDSLTLTAEGGKYKGEYKLERTKK